MFVVLMVFVCGNFYMVAEPRSPTGLRVISRDATPTPGVHCCAEAPTYELEQFMGGLVGASPKWGEAR